MSLDAGGLAQMTYNNTFNGGIGLPGAGFASRGKAANVKRLSVTTAPKMGTIDETQPAQPRTSRSHLLAGLRTAPKSPNVPASAPPTQLQQPGGLNDSRFANLKSQMDAPKSATSGSFPANRYDQSTPNRRGHMYTPSQVLAPPSIEIGDENGDFAMDPQMYDELVRTNQYLAEQQLRLQQQLINVTAAARQFQNLNLGQQQSPYAQNPLSPLTSMYNQQLQQGVQPIVEAVPGQPGLFVVFNPLTGQQNYFIDQSSQQQAVNEQNYSQNYSQNFELSHSPPPPTPTFRAEVSPPPESQSPTPMSSTNWRSQTPPKTASSPPREEHTPLPPPSANAFRPSHRKGLSLSNSTLTPSFEGPKTAGLRSAGLPMTPLSGTFGPGQAREGQHPIRQPRGPPSLEELVAKPTSKFEGSKNFATRQRRRAVNNLVRAGMERRGASRGNGSPDETGTPTSEHEINFSVSSDNESVRSGSASLSGRPSLGSLRPSIGAIGSERAVLKERSKDRSSVDSYTASSVSSEDTFAPGGKLMEVKAESPVKEDTQRKSTLAVLANAERRRSLIY